MSGEVIKFQNVPIMRPIKGYEGRYSITGNGKIWAHPNKSRLKGRWLKQCTSNLGYVYVCLFDGKERKNQYVHRLVAKTYIKEIGKPHINHKNGIKSDNRIKNLEWVTPRENKIHAYATGITVPNLTQLAQARAARRAAQ